MAHEVYKSDITEEEGRISDDEEAETLELFIWAPFFCPRNVTAKKISRFGLGPNSSTERPPASDRGPGLRERVHGCTRSSGRRGRRENVLTLTHKVD